MAPKLPTDTSNLERFEMIGYSTVQETRNVEQAKKICALRVHALGDALRAEVNTIGTALSELQHRIASLVAQLYEGRDAITDIEMFSRGVLLGLFGLLLSPVLFASVAMHVTTLILLGLPTVASLVFGLLLTGVTTAAGHLAFERPVRNATVQTIAGLVVLTGILLGLWQFGAVRGLLSNSFSAREQDPQVSFVDGQELADEVAASRTGSPAIADASLESRVTTLLGSANAKIMLAADATGGLLLALLAGVWTNPQFAAWRRLRRDKKEAATLESRREYLVAVPEIAWRNALAGILRGAHFADPPPRVLPYFKAIVIAAFLFGNALPGYAQTEANRHKVIVIDLSGSVASNASSSSLFNEYLHCTHAMLQVIPPNTRVWVFAISTDSFGGGLDTLLRGWTPSARGVFVDNLNRARRQMVSVFEAKSVGLSPSAAGTDIFGALARVNASAESSAGRVVEKELVILSDMVHESRGFNMRALVSTGADQMMTKAKSDGLVVPLHGWKIRVTGAATAGLTPQIWNTIKSFWTQYFAASGAELIGYSPDVAAK